tara:strand:+ start:78 stop:482 length:405 start_codon:yes stop_codon:yes gene_type:complete
MPYKDKDMYKKSQTILRWKRRGIIYHDYDELYERFLKQEKCEICEIILTRGTNVCNTRICCDHDHVITDDDNFRMFVCNCCNMNMYDKKKRPNKLNEEYISFHQNKYRVKRNAPRVDASFKTLEEAVVFRNEHL